MADAAVIEPGTQNGAPPSPAAPADWRTAMNDDLRADPVVSGWAEKASEKDVPGLIKGYAHLSKRLGSAINIPGKDAKPEDVAALKQKLYEAGVFTAPPADPKEYGLLKPEGLPKELQWSDELSNKFATALHKHGVPKAALADLMPLYMEALGGQAKTLQTNKDTAMAALKSEHGEKYDERYEMARRMIPAIFKTPEELQFAEDTGLADHPGFLGPMLRFAHIAMQDSSFVNSIPHAGGEMTGDQVRDEVNKIYNDPTHPMHQGFKQRDPKVEAHIQELYRKAYGNQ